jgi:hypothetical protein
MGYRSSPTCSHCYTTGHTKRFCPQMKKRASDWLESAKHLEGTDKYPSKPYFVREVEAYAESAKNRVCSWCDEGGHNKRTCPGKKKALIKNITRNKEWRQQILDKMKEIGLGVGALISRQSRYNDKERTLWFIKGMSWDVLNLRSSGNAVCYNDYFKGCYKDGQQYPQFIQTVRVKDGREGSIYAPNFKDEKGETLFYHGDDNHTVVSESVPSPPDDWVNDESWAKKLF